MKAALLSLLMGTFPLAIWAHGEDKLGPNGGYIRMPGGFHTEIKIKDKELLIYLLDINWKDPTLRNSSVKLDYINKDKPSTLICTPRTVEFSCALPVGFNSNEGKLLVVAERNGMKGATAEYRLPLKLSEPAKAKQQDNDEHSKHH